MVNADPQFQVEGFQYEIVREDRYEEILDLYKDHFLTDEPISRSLGLTMDDELRAILRVPLQQNLTIALVSKEPNDIVGGRVIKVDNKNKFDATDIQSEALKQCFAIFDEQDRRCNIFEYYNVNEVVFFYGFVVRRDYRHRGLGEKLMRAAIDFIHKLELGLVVIKAGGSSNYSQRVFEKLGFEKLSEIAYAEFKIDGNVVVKNTGEHKSDIRYGLSLN